MERALGWQVILRFEDDRVLAPSPRHRRALAAALADLGEAFEVFAWCVADTHLHVTLFGDLAAAREFARRLTISLQRRLTPGVPFVRPRITPICDRAHAQSLLLYVLRQSAHHHSQQDPFHEANCIHDLLGARTIAPWLAQRVQEHLPRVTRAQLLATVGIATFDERIGLDLDAAAAAFALPSLDGNEPARVAARAAVVHVAGSPTSALAAALGIHARTVRDLRARHVPIAHIQAIKRQMGLRAALDAATRTAPLVVRERDPRPLRLGVSHAAPES